jgi:hypothetical protein
LGNPCDNQTELIEMRNLVTAAAAALAMTLSLAAPALADHGTNNGPNNGQPGYGQPGYGQPGYGQPGYGQPSGDEDRGYGRGGPRGPGYGRGDERFDFDRHDRGFDRWERGWDRHGFRDHYRHRPLSHWQIIRRLEVQGYYGVRGLRPTRYGFGWRAFAFVGRGHPVMIRVNPYTGRVIDVRRIWA